MLKPVLALGSENLPGLIGSGPKNHKSARKGIMRGEAARRPQKQGKIGEPDNTPEVKTLARSRSRLKAVPGHNLLAAPVRVRQVNGIILNWSQPFTVATKSHKQNVVIR